MDMKIFDNTFTALERKLDLSLKRHKVLASNVANAETPNFRAREVDFAGELERALGSGANQVLKTTNAKHMDIGGNGTSAVVFDNVGAVSPNGNNVDLDIMMGKLSNNSRLFEGSVNLLQMKLRMLRMAAQGTGMM